VIGLLIGQSLTYLKLNFELFCFASTNKFDDECDYARKTSISIISNHQDTSSVTESQVTEEVADEQAAHYEQTVETTGSYRSNDHGYAETSTATLDAACSSACVSRPQSVIHNNSTPIKRQSYFQTSPAKTSKASEIRSEVAKMISDRNMNTDKQASYLKDKNIRDSLLNDLLIESEKKKEAHASEMHKLLIIEKQLDIKLKETQLKLLEKQVQQ